MPPYTSQRIVGRPSPDNPHDEKPKVAPEQYDVEKLYDEKDKRYLSFLQSRLEKSKRLKEQAFPEFNGKTYYQYYEENEKIANTHHLDQKKNPDDVVFSAGTIEQKLDALLSHINNLNLSPEVMSFDRENNRIMALGLALEDIIHDTEVRDGADGAGDEEKKMMRQRELLKQGTVFVQEEWSKRYEMKKKLKEKYNGEFKEFSGYTTKLEKVFEGPSRTLLYGPNVFLGDITKFHMQDQPYIFVMIHTSYDDAKTKYGKFENWKYVVKGNVPDNDLSQNKTIYDNKWRLTDLQDDQVEIILYQDQARDEFQIIINGVCMLPMGFPLSAVSPRGVYNVAKQVFRIISDKFAYGGSFVASGSIKEIANLIDEMLKLFVLKTRKSFTPAYVNTSGRVIDRKVLSPGRISMGIDPQSLQPIAGNEVQGITAGESNFLEKMQSLIDKSTVSDTFTGQQGKSGTTATEILEVQRQARLTLGLTIAACSLLEKKLAYLRLWNILENWFEPVDRHVKEIEGARQYVNQYRKTTRDTSIEGEGPGERQVVVQDGELPEDNMIRAIERAEEEAKGRPVRKVYINAKGIRTAGLLWFIAITPKERESSPFFKVLFREMLGDMAALMNLGSQPNREGLEEEFARVWGKPRNKLFASTQMSPDMAGVSGAGSPQGGGGPSSPGSAGAGRASSVGGTLTPGNLATASAAAGGGGEI